MTRPSILKETLRALVLPKRIVPVGLVCLPLLGAQHSYSEDPLAVPLAVLMCLAFVSIAPVSWRILFPDDLATSNAGLRLLLYAGIGAGVVLTLGAVVPKFLGMGPTFLTQRAPLFVSGAMFLVGGWGLGRDIGLEMSLAREKVRAAAYAREAEQAQLLALRGQLDPHFLFNTLNAIAEWCRQDGETAERAVLQLSAILRTVLQGVKVASWPLERELELTKNLFALHHLRSPSAFTTRFEVPIDLSARPVPPLILLPIAENAMKHGPSAGHHGEVSIVVTEAGGGLRIVVENPGPYAGPREGSDGLPTVMRRLALAYGGRAQLSISGHAEKTRLEMMLPLEGPLPGVSV
jgi:hypothetical protein